MHGPGSIHPHSLFLQIVRETNSEAHMHAWIEMVEKPKNRNEEGGSGGAYPRKIMNHGTQRKDEGRKETNNRQSNPCFSRTKQWTISRHRDDQNSSWETTHWSALATGPHSPQLGAAPCPWSYQCFYAPPIPLSYQYMYIYVTYTT